MIRRPVIKLSTRAFTLAEVIMTIALVGVLAAVAIPVYCNVHDASRRIEATDHLESLNKAVKSFAQNCWEFPHGTGASTAPNAASADDEFIVLRSLQYQWAPNSGRVGSPYYQPDYNPQPSSNLEFYRARWTGSMFEMLEPGTTGTGMSIDPGARGTAAGQTVYYPPPIGFKPAGSP